ncbi:cytochrome P450 monooxygenase [Fusarium tjaetaba]|uniref:Cytochrome P450 monooxygenase n=1 Tax=Fusarium tjaetaba TaxID=1567544 RepID=A0A8H5QIN5_9HYPO|nr:cytochrome P450 monooxygenase [Fusarium tjaetaba]KAF5617290.1 cytochrome P450 monooxygenase [Fusarium tjaetaba]
MALPLLEIAGTAFVAILIYNIISIYTSPLSKIPSAGFGATFSRLLWTFPQEYKGAITLTLPELHKKLGPLIRIGPNEVSFYSRETYETVHKVGSKFKKDPRVYGQFVQGGHAALFSITQVTTYANNCERLTDIQQRSGRAFQAKEDHGTALFPNGEQLAMVEKNDEKATWMPVLTNFPMLCEFWEHVEQSLYTLTGFRTKYSQGLLDFHDVALSAESDYGTSVSSPNLIQTLCKAGLPAETALSEAGENLGPGTDTTSATLAHILWAFSHNPTFQDALYQDLASVDFSTDMTTLENIPRLQACVKEGIRWAGAAAAMLPRIVPPGGIELHDTFIPEGTVLTSSPIWYLHDENAFPNPKLYDPYRWLSKDGKDLTADVLRDRYYIPFSRGANLCLGAQ